MRRRPPGWENTIGLTYYPSFGFERLPDPVGERAIDQRGVRIAVWRRALVRLRIVGIAAAGSIGALLAGASTSWNAYAVAAIVAASGVLLGSAVGLCRLEVLRRRLTRSRWTVYECQSIRMAESFPISMILVNRATGATFWVKIRQSRRSEVMRGMARPEVWLAHYSARRGMLTVAGGGEMFVARTVRNAPITPRIIPQPKSFNRSHRLSRFGQPPIAPIPTPTPVEPWRAALDEEKRRRLRAQREARRVKRAAEEVRQPKLPSIRGARRLRFK